jgi:hypothetical protein
MRQTSNCDTRTRWRLPISAALNYFTPSMAGTPSVEGHNVLADAAFKNLGPSLEFLGIGDFPLTPCFSAVFSPESSRVKAV